MKSYRPSNGTDGSFFEAEFCERCSKEDLETETFCKIHSDALLYLETEKDYPKEWIEDEKGPRCTAFKRKE